MSEEVQSRIAEIVKTYPVMVFMKGNPDQPQCGFSARVAMIFKDYGKPFAEIFKNYKGDFYAIDPNLFSPGKVTVISLETGKIFTEGELNNNLLDKSFGYEKK